MSSDYQRQSANQQQMSNQFYVSETALQLRLDTSQLVENVRSFMRGKTIILQDNGKGGVITSEIEHGRPKANDRGVQAVINRVQMIINPATVQGNYTEEQYKIEIGQIRRSLRDTIMINLHEWDIKEEDYEDIIDSVMATIKAFLSRLIDNKERESYAQTVKTTEVQSHESGRRGLI